MEFNFAVSVATLKQLPMDFFMISHVETIEIPRGTLVEMKTSDKSRCTIISLNSVDYNNYLLSSQVRKNKFVQNCYQGHVGDILNEEELVAQMNDFDFAVTASVRITFDCS